MSRAPTTAETIDLHAPDDVVWIARKLESAGHDTWAVGGAVRDALAGTPPGDWDLTTSARPPQVRRVFRRTVPIGIEHGTVGVIARSGKLYEVTTFRRDVETFGRHARVVFASTLEEDLHRRDFTMNAVAWHPLTHEVRDPHGGRDDLAAGVLRTVGDPALRFEEDRLRVLRALRFAGAFELRIHPDTWSAIVASADELGDLSAERVREELRKILIGQRNPSRSLHLYAESGVLRALYPELAATVGVSAGRDGKDLWSQLVRAACCARPTRYRVRVAALLHAVGAVPSREVGREASEPRMVELAGREPTGAARSAALARQLLRRLRSSNADTDTITHLIAHHAPVPAVAATDADLRRWIRGVGADHLHDLFRLLFAIARAHAEPEACRELIRLRARSEAVLAARPPLSVADLAIGGAELRELGLPPGPRYGTILDACLERVLEDPSANTRETLLEIASRLAAGG